MVTMGHMAVMASPYTQLLNPADGRPLVELGLKAVDTGWTPQEPWGILGCPVVDHFRADGGFWMFLFFERLVIQWDFRAFRDDAKIFQEPNYGTVRRCS